MNAPALLWLSSLARPGRPDEYEVKRLLLDYGIPCPKGVRIAPDAAVRLWDLQPPFAVKVCSPDVPHKTEQRAILLKRTEKNVGEAVADLRTRFPGEAVLIEEMIVFEEPEIIVGGLQDSVLGAALMVGAGGIMTELYKDVAFRLAPLSPDEAGRMLDELVIAPVFSGFRGFKHSKKELASICGAVSMLLAEFGGVCKQLDINPIVYNPEKGWHALDGLMQLDATRLPP